MTQAVRAKFNPLGNKQENRRGLPLRNISDIAKTGSSGVICVRVYEASGLLQSRNGWKYRRLRVRDKTMAADILISDESFSDWKIRTGDHVACKVRSTGTDAQGFPIFYFDEFLGPFESSELIFDLHAKVTELGMRSGERMRSSETVYQISAREARSLLVLIRLWMAEGRPQHYNKWCQMHQIVATNLYYMGLVRRTASMSGFYYPTEEALEFFLGRRKFPKKKVFTKDKNGRHVLASEEGPMRTFSDYLSDYADRESALAEYSDALEAYHRGLRSFPSTKSEARLAAVARSSQEEAKTEA